MSGQPTFFAAPPTGAPGSKNTTPPPTNSPWAFFQAQPLGYRKLTIYRVLAAKTPRTQARRLALLIDASAQARRLATATQMEPLKERS